MVVAGAAGALDWGCVFIVRPKGEAEVVVEGAAGVKLKVGFAGAEPNRPEPSVGCCDDDAAPNIANGTRLLVGGAR